MFWFQSQEIVVVGHKMTMKAAFYGVNPSRRSTIFFLKNNFHILKWNNPNSKIQMTRWRVVVCFLFFSTSAPLLKAHISRDTCDVGAFHVGRVELLNVLRLFKLWRLTTIDDATTKSVILLILEVIRNVTIRQSTNERSWNNKIT